ncbi:alpha-tocopherol transfer protein-like [Manduca sexta]
MEELKPTNILKFNPNQMADVRKVFGYGDIGILKQDIKILEDWINKQNHFIVRDFGRDYLERFLIYNKGSVERAKKHFDRLCTFRNLMPEFLRDFDVRNEFVDLFKCSQSCVMPTPTPDNYRVVISKMFGNHENVALINYYRYLVVFTEYILLHDYCQGSEMIVDTRDILFSMVAKLNPIVVHKAMTLIIETMGQRVKAIHFISGSKFLDTVINIIKQGLSEKLRKRIYTHNDFESLHKHIPREILPKDYGGNGATIKELSEANFKELSTDEHIARLKFLEKAATNEDLRLSCKFNEEYSGLPGAFKTLCVD